MKTPRRKRRGYQLQSFTKPAPDSDRGSVDRESSILIEFSGSLLSRGRRLDTCLPKFIPNFRGGYDERGKPGGIDPKDKIKNSGQQYSIAQGFCVIGDPC